MHKVSDIPFDVTYYKILRENHKFSKHNFFYNLLKDGDEENINIVKKIIYVNGYKIFETLGTDDPFIFWGNMDIYFEDKTRALQYLWNYGERVFQELLKEKFGYVDVEEHRTFYMYSSNGVIKEWMINIGFTTDHISIFKLKPPADSKIIYKDREDKKNNFEYQYPRKNINLSKLIPIIHGLNESKLKHQRDYRLYLMYIFTKHFIHDLRRYARVARNDIYFIFVLIQKNIISFEKNNEFYILLDAIFYIYYLRENKRSIDTFDELFNIFDEYELRVEFIERMTNVYKAIGRNEKVKIPEPLNELKYELKFNEYAILEMTEKKNDFIDPNRSLVRIGLKTLLKNYVRYNININRPFLQEIFGIIFFSSKRRNWRIKSKGIAFTFNITERMKTQFIEVFRKINPKLEKMFIEGTLDTKAFIPGIRLFNELYTVLKIFPWIIENKNETDFLYDLDKHLKMLIFTSQEERDIFKSNFIDDNNNFMDMTQEKLNTYKKMD